jgi:hypothetical protein
MLEDPTFEDGFYDFKSQKFVKMDGRIRADCVALRYLIDKDDEFYLQFVVSDITLQELDKTSSVTKRRQLLDILEALKNHFEHSQVEYLSEEDLPPLCPGDEGFWHGLYQRGRLDFLPDQPDRRLILDSVLQRAHIFLTVDYKTIWDHRDRLRELGVNVRRPSEYIRDLLYPAGTAISRFNEGPALASHRL